MFQAFTEKSEGNQSAGRTASLRNELTARGLDVVNRTAFNDNIQGVVAARYIIQELGAERIVVLHNQTSYGEALATTVCSLRSRTVSAPAFTRS